MLSGRTSEGIIQTVAWKPTEKKSSKRNSIATAALPTATLAMPSAIRLTKTVWQTKTKDMPEMQESRSGRLPRRSTRKMEMTAPRIKTMFRPPAKRAESLEPKPRDTEKSVEL
jgi:hypothetical protein